MISNGRNLSLIAALAMLGLAGTAAAQAPLGTRAAGLAGAFVGVADDASAVYWNPAGLATGGIVSFLATFSEEKTGAPEAGAISGGRLAGRMVALSLPPVGIAYYRLSAFATERAPAVTGPGSREEVRRSVHRGGESLTTSTVGVSLLQSLTDYLVVGATPKLVQGAGRTTFDVDAGVMMAVARVRLGVVARNLTTPAFAGAVGEGGEIELSREARIGAAWGSGWPGHSRLMISVDGDLTSRPTPIGDRRDVAAGVETWWRDRRLGLRGGVRRSMVGEPRAAVAAGVSAGLTPGLLLEAHVVQGHMRERGWSLGVRMGF